MDPDLIRRLRDALTTAGYEYDAVVALLGPVAHAALSRNETTPGLRATGDGSPLATLVRLWLLQAAVPLADAERALGGLVDALCAEGVLRRSVGEVAAAVDLRPYGTDEGNLWIASDLTPGLDGGSSRVGADHVLGISSASTTLAQLTVREPVARALDLGTGCGVQALHLAAHARSVVATDVNRRALWLAGLNAGLNVGLNGVSTGPAGGGIELREGSFFEPVRGEEFDLIATNPPFVISPATGERLVYRDSGLPGDRVVEHVVRTAPRHLREGGICQVLANWMILADRPWEERLSEWLDGADARVDAWVVQREVADLPSYVELWLKDAGLHGAPDYRERYDTWLSWFEEQGAQAVGFGWLNLRRTAQPPALRLEEWPWEVAQPLGGEVAAHFARVDLLRHLDDRSLLGTRPVTRVDVLQETHGSPGAEDPAEIVLRQQAGMRRARQVDTATAALVGACDGELELGRLLAAVEQLVGAAVPMGTVRELVEEGFLTL
ncbi:MAG TPA: methyltransferase [Marmoricola sp.]